MIANDGAFNRTLFASYRHLASRAQWTVLRIEYILRLSRENTLAQTEGTQTARHMKLIRKHKKSTLAFAESLELEDKQEAAINLSVPTYR